jgi:hypothetical protein
MQFREEPANKMGLSRNSVVGLQEEEFRREPSAMSADRWTEAALSTCQSHETSPTESPYPEEVDSEWTLDLAIQHELHTSATLRPIPAIFFENPWAEAD